MILLLSSLLFVGGGALNVMVPYNTQDTSAVEIAQYYIPQQHLCRLTDIEPDETSIDLWRVFLPVKFSF